MQRKWFSLGVGATLMAVAFAGQTQDAPAQAANPPSAATGLFVTVNGVEVSQRDFHIAHSNYLRQKFFHGKVPEQQLQEAREEVINRLVEGILIRQEIARRGVAPDNEEVERKLANYEKRYAGSPSWPQMREAAFPAMRAQFSEQSQFDRLEQTIRSVPAPAEAEVRRFYDERPDLFTEPEKLRLHTILLRVEPSSPAAIWEAARSEAALIVKRLRGGSDFGEAARMHSNDKSAEAGGDMGYLHRGMLSESVHQSIDAMKPGELSEPLDVLEGVAIFRLDERVPAKLREFPDVAARAGELLLRERQESAWNAFRDELRRKAVIVFHEQPVVPQSSISGK